MAQSLYRSVAVASAFSPRFMPVLTEAKRMAERFEAPLSLIYVGQRSSETEAKFRGALEHLQLPLATPIIYQEGDPASAILQACQANAVDLLLAGALEKEVVLRPFLGNVARRLIKESTCSVVLFTRPQTEPAPLRRIAFLVDYSEYGAAALREALALAAREKTEIFHAVRVYTAFDKARAGLGHAAPKSDERTLTFSEEEAALEKFLLAAEHTPVPIEACCIRGNTGWAASDFVQSVKADLLIVPVPPDAMAGAELPRRVAWITDVIPCNVWVIR